MFQGMVTTSCDVPCSLKNAYVVFVFQVATDLQKACASRIAVAKASLAPEVA